MFGKMIPALFLVATFWFAPAHAANDLPRMMTLLERWIGGHYSTKQQYDADQASDKSDTEKHRLMYQLFLKADLPGFDGLIFFEQGSMGGTADPDQIWRAGFLQFIPDPERGVIRQRELHFKDDKPFRNAHLTPEKFKTISRDLLEWDANCDFLLNMSKDETEIAGPIPSKACTRENPGTGAVMYADDRIVIKNGEFWFLGRYRDADGTIIWGNESAELNKLVRFKMTP